MYGQRLSAIRMDTWFTKYIKHTYYVGGLLLYNLSAIMMLVEKERIWQSRRGIGLLRTAFEWRALWEKKHQETFMWIYEVDQKLEVTNLLASMSLQLKTGIVSRQFWIILTRCILSLKRVCILSLCLKHQWVKEVLHFEESWSSCWIYRH